MEERSPEEVTTTIEPVGQDQQPDEGASQLDLLEAAEAFVKEHFQHHDPSHDWHHVHRVRLMALALTQCPSLQGKGVDLLVVELGALFHDLCDRKYLRKSEQSVLLTASTLTSRRFITAHHVLSPFLTPFAESGQLQAEQLQTILRIVDNVSWSKEEARRDRMAHNTQAGVAQAPVDLDQAQWEAECLEFQCVSDADRLDAIGSFGILRVAAFSAVHNRPLHIPPANAAYDSQPPAEQASGYNGSAVAHFHQKLLRIQGDRLWIDKAKQEAARRQTMMRSFLAELDMEWMVADQGAQLALLDG